MLEALWEIVKIIEGTEEGLSRSEEGIRAIRDTVRYALIDEEVTKNAIHRYRLGHRDIIDNLLFSLLSLLRRLYLYLQSLHSLSVGRRLNLRES